MSSRGYYHDPYREPKEPAFTDAQWKEFLNRLSPDEWWVVTPDGRIGRQSGTVEGLSIRHLQQLITGAKIRFALTGEDWLEERIELLTKELVRAKRHDKLISDVAAEGITWGPGRRR